MASKPYLLTDSQARVIIKHLKKSRLRYLRQMERKFGRLSVEQEQKVIETLAIIQTLGGAIEH